MLELWGLSLLALVTIILVLVFDFVNGFHDSANSIATIVGTKVLTPIKAVSLAAIFNFVGIIAGQAVAKTIGTGIINTELLVSDGQATSWAIILIFAAAMGAIIWDLITWRLGLPTSSSHALIGGLIGAGLTAAALHWESVNGVVDLGFSTKLGEVLEFMVISPLAGLAIAFVLSVVILNIVRTIPPLRRRLDAWIARRRGAAEHSTGGAPLLPVPKRILNWLFRNLQLFSSAFYSFTHGTNDAQKGMGMMTMVLVIEGVVVGDLTRGRFVVPLVIMVAAHAAISFGTFFGGWRIVRTMAFRITRLQPWQGFSAETGAGAMLYATATLGIPVSTTHTISGAIMGVGATKRLSAVRWGLGRRIVYAWLLTIPMTALVAAAVFLVADLLA